jgi:16S rRNA (guanine1516-N2)-methyltransferase
LSSPLPSLAVLDDPHGTPSPSHLLARSLGIPLVTDPLTATLLLQYTQERLELCKPGDPELPGALWVDFTGPTARRRSHHPHRELLVQAAKVRKTAQPLLIDATAGLGRDGFLLAAAGFRVRMVECNPVVAALLEDGLNRARRIVELAGLVERIHLFAGDALEYLPGLTEQPDVIYLDPMFPERTKSAKVKQELRLLQLLNQKTASPEHLLQAALALQPKKVVVKRPLKGPHLLAMLPSYALRGKAVRFDVYVGEGKKAPNP